MRTFLNEYSKPGAVEIGLIEAGDDLLHEITGGAGMASLSEQKRRLLRISGGRRRSLRWVKVEETRASRSGDVRFHKI